MTKKDIKKTIAILQEILDNDKTIGNMYGHSLTGTIDFLKEKLKEDNNNNEYYH